MNKIYFGAEKVTNGFIVSVRKDDAGLDTFVVEGDAGNLMYFIRDNVLDNLIDDFNELSFLVNIDTVEKPDTEKDHFNAK
jgi:hypothetical protein